MRLYFSLPLLALIGLLGTSCAMVEKAAPGTLSDANILSLLNTADRADIEGGHLAQLRATSPSVQNYGRRMVDEHSAMLSANKQLSRRVNIQPVSSALGEKLADDHDETMQGLRDKPGTEFDRAYIDHEITTHEQLIGLVDRAANKIDNATLRQQVLQAKPRLQAHLDAARSIKRTLVAQTNQ